MIRSSGDAPSKKGRWKTQTSSVQPPPFIPPAFTTPSLHNYSTTTATPSESYVTFGAAFKQGDIPSGSTPYITRQDTFTQLPAQFDLRSTWSDGSLRWCEVSLIAPSIPAGGSLQIGISSVVGAYNNTSGRVLNDVISNITPRVSITNCTDYTGATYMGGAQVADFNTATTISDGLTHLEHIKSGPVCDQWKAWMWFPGQGANQHLAAWFYVTAWTKHSDSTLACISHLAKVHNGFLFYSGGVATKFNYDAVYSDGLSLSTNYSTTNTFTVASSTTITCTAHGRSTGDPVTFTNSGGALPTPLVANTVYYVGVVDANTLKVYTSGSNAQTLGSGSQITNLSGGSGTNSLLFRIYHVHHTDWWTCTTDGRPNWTANQATIFVQPDKVYLHSTGILPPYRLSLQPSPSTLSPTTNVYVPFGSAFFSVVAPMFDQSLSTTGGSQMRGWLPQWAINAFLTGDPGFAQVSRVNARLFSGLPAFFHNELTGKIVPFRGTSQPNGATGNYPGLGSTIYTLLRYLNPNIFGGGIKAATGGEGGWGLFDWSHMPMPYHYTIVTEGGADLIDAAIVWTNNALLGAPSGTTTGYGVIGTPTARNQNVTASDPIYYGTWCRTYASNMRAIGWIQTAMCQTTSVIPDQSPSDSPTSGGPWIEKQYFKDLLTGNSAYAAAWVANPQTANNTAANFLNVGHWAFSTGNGEWAAAWMPNFMIGAVGWTYFLHGQDPNALIWANHICKRPIGYTTGLFCPAAGDALVYQSFRSSTPGDYTDWPDLSVETGFNTQANMTTNTFSTAVSGTNSNSAWALNNSDKIKWTSYNLQGGLQTIPTPIVADQWYWIVNISGTSAGGYTFKISTTDPAITTSYLVLTSNGGQCENGYRPSVCPSTYLRAVGSADQFIAATQSAMAMCAVAGISGTSAAFDAYDPYTKNLQFASQPEWCMQKTL